MIDEVYTWQYRKRGLTTTRTPGEIQFSPCLNWIIHTFIKIWVNSRNNWLTEYILTTIFWTFPMLLLCFDFFLWLRYWFGSRPYPSVPVTIVSNYTGSSNSRYPIGKSLFSVNVDCPRQRGKLSWRVVTKQFDDTWLHMHWVVKPDLLNFQVSNENVELGIILRTYIRLFCECEKSERESPFA